MVHPSLDEIYRLFRKGLEKVHSDHIYKFKDYAECVFDTQVLSKRWLTDELGVFDVKHISILASWYGIVIVPMLVRKFGNIPIDLYDVDEYTMDIAKHIYKDDYPNVTVNCKDVIFDDVEFKGDTIINCSCEHMYDMADMVNQYRGRRFVLQSNNNRNVKWLHINCVDTAQELIEQADIREVLYKGDTEMYKATRFMVIGK
tara:strand:+ start:29 stop:631 length:603 start_codon:yes stop_codon:yes gene_type:complete